MEGNTAWMLLSTALVLFMVPGLALFYGGMVRSKNVPNMLNMNTYCLGIVPLVWVLVAFSLGNSGDGDGLEAFIGNLDALGLKDVKGTDALIAVAFSMTFAAITPALIAGAVADRIKFSAWAIFVPIWSLIVYTPVFYWVYVGWHHSKLDPAAIDFAGGTAIHINAGVAALALVMVLGKRAGWPDQAMPPHNLPFVMLGAGILWFGWFGFNAGSAYAADNTAAIAATNTLLATCAAGLAWLIVEKIRDKKATSLGAASGIVAGLVAITPACANVTPMGAILLGLVAGAVCAWAVTLKYKLGFDDSFDVVGIHLVGGLVGTLALGFLASDLVEEGGQNGLLYGGDLNLLIVQIIAAAGVMVYSFILAGIIALALKATTGIRSDEEDEVNGIDVAEHAETAYELGDSGAGGAFAGVGQAARAKEVE